MDIEILQLSALKEPKVGWNWLLV